MSQFSSTGIMAVDNLNLSFAGLLFIARLLPLNEAAVRAMLHGPPSFLEIFVVYPSMQTPIIPSTIGFHQKINGASLISGKSFSIRNQALSFFLEAHSKDGCLTTFNIGERSSSSTSYLRRMIDVMTVLVPMLAAMPSLISHAGHWAGGDTWFLGVFALLFLTRFISISMLHSQVRFDRPPIREKGQKQDDLIVRVGEYCWVRVKGHTEALVSSGSETWLRHPSSLESCLMFASTLLVYLAAVLAANISPRGQLTILLTLPLEEVLLWSSNNLTYHLDVAGETLSRSAQPEPFSSLESMARGLVEEYSNDSLTKILCL